MTPIRRAFALALLATAPLYTAQELLRVTVVGDAETSHRRLTAIRDHADVWLAYTIVGLLFALAVTAALLGMALVLADRAPRWALVGGILAVVTGVANGLHLGVYATNLGALSVDPAQYTAVGQILARSESHPLSVLAILLFALGMTVTPVVLAAGLWRTRLVAWWAALTTIAWPILAILAGSGLIAAASGLLAMPLFTLMAARLAGRTAGPDNRTGGQHGVRRSGTDTPAHLTT